MYLLTFLGLLSTCNFVIIDWTQSFVYSHATFQIAEKRYHPFVTFRKSQSFHIQLFKVWISVFNFQFLCGTNGQSIWKSSNFFLVWNSLGCNVLFFLSTLSFSYFRQLIFKAQQTFKKDYYHSALGPLWVKLVIYSLYALLYRQNRSPIYQHFSTSHYVAHTGFCSRHRDEARQLQLTASVCKKHNVWNLIFRSLNSIVKK